MITVTINGKKIPEQKIRQWEEKRLAWSSRFLKRRLGGTQKLAASRELLDFKLCTPEDRMRQALKAPLAISGFLAMIMTKLSFGKRKLCVTELFITGSSAEKLSGGFNDMMLKNTHENRAHCLAACPDHYLLKGCKADVQEVIEVAGSMPLPLQFFVSYGDEKGLITAKDKSYPFGAAGVARLKSGLAMGGVRHQMRDIEGGCAVKLTVEFPALMPNQNVREHQLHLACEFYNWFTVLLTK